MGALNGLKIVEFGGIGPGPFCCMLLADMGAEVIRIDRVAAVGKDRLEPKFNPMHRGQRSIALDLKHPDGVNTALRLCDKADIVIEGFRPGVMEGLGLGPEMITARNAKIIYGRMTGWGQTGPLAQAPGHDLNYIALTGALHAIGKANTGPVPPLVLAGDMGGGGMYLAVGVLAAYIESQRSGKGQVVDAAIVDGSASLMTAFYGMLASGSIVEKRESNRLDGGSHFYNVYETKDGQYVCVASTEPQFYSLLVEALGLNEADIPQNDRNKWPQHRATIANVFKQKTRDEWNAWLAEKNLCYSPVLSMSEAPHHPHNAVRGNFVDIDGVTQPAPAPRFSRTKSVIKSAPAYAGADTTGVLNDWGFAPAEIEALIERNAAKQRPG